MAKTMSKTDLLERMIAAHEALEQRLERLNEGQMIDVDVYDGLTVKDVLAHLAAWMRLEIGWIEATRRGETPTILAPGYELGDGDNEAVINRLNTHFYQTHQAEALADVRTEFQASHAALLALVQSMPETELTDPHRFPWCRGRPVWRSIALNTYRHYQEHIDLLDRISDDDRSIFWYLYLEDSGQTHGVGNNSEGSKPSCFKRG